MNKPTCAHCCNPIPPKPAGKPGPAPKYCSRSCQAKAKHKRTYAPKPRATTNPGAWKHHPGDSKDDLLLIGRLGTQNGEQWGLFACRCGMVVEKDLHNVFNGPVSNCATPGRHIDGRNRATPPDSYDSAHKHAAKVNGPARDHRCLFCPRPAEQNAYSHADCDQQADSEGREAGKPYSINPRHYWPMCRSCHTKFDNAHRRMAGGKLSLAHVVLWTAASGDQVEEEVVV